MSEENRRRSQRANFGVPPQRLGAENIEGFPGNALQVSEVQEIHSHVLERSIAENKTLSVKSVALSRVSNHSRLEEIQARKIEVEKRLLQLEMAQLAEEEKSIRRSHSSVRDLEFNEEKNDDIHLPPDDMNCKSYVNAWLENTERENHTSHQQDHNISRTLVECMKDLNMNLNKIVTKQSVRSLEDFSGDISEFPFWLKEFHRTTEEKQISDSDNLYRLQRCLKGSAREAVKELLCSPDNITNIINNLKLNFGREEWIIINQIEKAKRFGNLKEDSLESFMQFSNVVSNMVISIKNVGSGKYLENPELLLKLEGKLPSNPKRSWAQEKLVKRRENVTANLEHFAEWVQSEVQMMMEVSIPSQVSNAQNHLTKKNSGQQLERRGFFHAVENSFPSCCILCDKDYHRLSECEVFLKYNVEERKTFVQNNRYCFRCLKFGHLAKKCYSKILCNVNACKRRHHRLVHEDFANMGDKDHQSENEVVGFAKIEKSKLEKTEELIENEKSRQEVVAFLKNRSSILKIARVRLASDHTCIETHALLDEGSTITLVDSEIIEELRLLGQKTPICLQWANNISHQDDNSMLVNFEISQPNDNKKLYQIRDARTIRNLCLPEQKLNIDYLKSKYSYIDPSVLELVANAKPKLLIGQDNASLIVSLEVIQPRYDQPVLSRTRLGWVIHGPYAQSNQENIVAIVNLCRHGDNDLQELIEDNFRMENAYRSNDMTEYSEEDKKALEIYEKTIRRTGNHFEIGMPWRREHVIFPETKNAAFNRLKCMEKKMDKSPDFAEKYCNTIKEYIEKGYAERIQVDKQSDNGRVWYLPHFGVLNVNKPGKFRFVFDAAAKVSGVCLNDFLLTGPDFYPLLVSVLWRFREGRYAFCGDIKEMFHQVLIQKEDRACQRFLFRGMDRNREPDIYQMRAMIFGAVCSPSIAQFVKNFNASQLRDQYPDIMRIMLKQHYVDDYLDCKNSLEEAIMTVKNVIEVHRRGGFQMVNWLSNSKDITDSIPEEYRSKKNSLLNLDTKNLERVLGLYWNINTDVFVFNLNLNLTPTETSQNDQKPTKRKILKLVMTIFDPIGFISPLVVKGRLIFQECWRQSLEWDEEIPNELNEKWQRWCEDVQKIENFKIPRWYFKIDPDEVELHVFCDASDRAYCAVAYYKLKKSAEISFVSSKCKLGPLNKVTSIPRMELQGAVIAARLGHLIQKETNYFIIRTCWWTDSEIVLKWLNSKTCRLKQYEAHRVQEITELTKIEDWRWVPSSMNPADLATKGGNSLELMPDGMWFQGPAFLKQRIENWPKCTVRIENSMPGPSEVACLLSTIQILELPDSARFSKWSRFLHTVAWIKRYIENLKSTYSQKETSYHGTLSVEEINIAEAIVWKGIQQRHFMEEIKALSKKDEVDRSSPIYQLSPFLDENSILRMDSRIKYADVEFNTKFPIILPSEKKERVIQLLIQHYHERIHHTGHETVVNNLKQTFWIVTLRQSVKNVIRNCQFCKNRRAKPVQPEMAPLPEYRLQQFVRPFSYCGLDYFGPILVKVKRSIEKRYGALFTCLNTRAVHLEIANSLSTDSALMAIGRFIARRGKPLEIHSDNGTNFVGAENEMKKCLDDMDQNKLQNELLKHKTKWIFQVPGAPHMSGSWERLVKSVKTVLYLILNESHPSEELLHTLLLETESIVNSRPISYVSNHPGDQLEALTPMHFLIGTANTENLPGKFGNNDLFGRKQWRMAQVMAEKFWQRWIKEYIPSLQKRAKWHAKTSPLEIGDVVAIPSPSPRKSWKLARVSKIFPGKDNQIRSVEITSADGKLIRPVNVLLRLEVGDCGS